jgi:hypothetical protein
VSHELVQLCLMRKTAFLAIPGYRLLRIDPGNGLLQDTPALNGIPAGIALFLFALN